MQRSAVADLSAVELEGFGGQVVRPDDADYDEARAVYNGMIDRRPGLIARCSGVADVVDAVNVAREKGLLVAVRCGGHSVAGNAVCDDGILLDLSGMKSVLVDPAARTARANGGVLWGEFDRETQVFGLATAGGRVSATGVGGFTLGGGYAWISPKYGLACDNLISAQVVTADGRVLVASEDENEDLFWGIRGGSGNFGVVTSYDFQLHELGPMVLAGLLIFPIDAAPEVMRAWRDHIENAPEELCSGTATLLAPPEPFVPEELHGRPVFGTPVIYAGDLEEGAEFVQPLKDLDPAVDLVEPMPYTAFQAMLDPFAPPGWLNYHRGEHLSGLPDEAIDVYLEHGAKVASPMDQCLIFRHGGAISRVQDDAMAASYREAPYMWHPIACWQDPADTEREIAWVRETSEALRPFTTGVYLNFEQDEGEEHVKTGFSKEKFRKLTELKAKYDPENLFRVNQNIPPAR
jgi:FAD binding domain/Berberine and berberine like